MRKFFTKLSAVATIGILVFYVLIATFEKVSGESLNIRQKFKSGDVISADMFNELFAAISRVISTPTMSDVVGTWQCTKYMAYSINYDNMFQHYATPDAAGLWRTLQVPVKFTDNGNGTYSWDSGSTYNAFELGGITSDTCAGNGNISLLNGKFAITSTACGSAGGYQNTRIYEVRNLSTTKIEINQMGGDVINSLSFLCDKQDIPPTAPDNLSATVSGSTVTLSWTDNSGTEKGFKVLRKDSLMGSYVEIAVAPANTAIYQDTIANSGTYWYWIKATNTDGDSDGSNVMSVDYK